MTRARRAAILPHAPLLVPDVARSRAEPEVERVRGAMRAAARAFSRPVVVVSPHGASTGVYVRESADLRAFGVTRADARVDVPARAAHDLAEAWGRPVLDRSLDHGIAVPAIVGEIRVPVIGVAFAEGQDPAEDAARLAAVLRDADHDVVASVNTGAGITPRAPMTQLAGAEKLEGQVRDAVTRDAAAIAPAALRLASEGASCCLGPLLVLADLFAGTAGRVLAHEWPFGVGYMVATFGEPA